MIHPTGMLCVVPSRLGVGEPFELRIKLLGPVRPIPTRQQLNTPKPALSGPFNLNAERRIQYHDNVLPEWLGTLRIDGGDALDGPNNISFDGINSGVFPGDTRPIGCFGGFRWRKPGFHFLRVVDPESGLECLANAVHVTAAPPTERIYWGDPHWQTFFSDGIRCPEELYAFARNEAFLDFGAISDHVEALTDRQWDYFVAVTNDCNEPGRYVTFVGLEWTSREFGHRNVYYPGESGPILRSNDPAQRTLEQIYRVAREHGALVIPHHSANVTMGVDWTLGHDPEVERLVEIHSVWGTSEMPASQGNPRPIRTMGGEKDGQHVVDALRMGRLYGFVGGGDIHDGRPGDELHSLQDEPEQYRLLSRQGIMGVWAEDLTRESVFEALWNRRGYAVSNIRVLLDFTSEGAPMGSVRPADAPRAFCVFAASESPITSVVVMKNGNEFLRERPNRATVTHEFSDQTDHEPASYYVRIEREDGETAWSSPIWFR